MKRIIIILAILLTASPALTWDNGPWRGLDPAFGEVKMWSLGAGTDTEVEGANDFICAMFPFEGTWELCSIDAVAVPSAGVYTASDGGDITIQVHREIDGDNNQWDMLSTAITIENGERSSFTAATAPAVGEHYTLAAGCWVCVELTGDGCGGSAQAGLVVNLPLRKQ